MGARKIKKKLLFGITSLQLGGAERVLVDISNRLCDDYDISIFSIYDNGELKKELNSDIKFKSFYGCKYEEIGKLKRLLIPLKILFFGNAIYEKKVKHDYDVEIAFLEGPITRIFSKKNKNTKKIAWIHNDIKKVFGTGIKSRIKRGIDKKIYQKYDELVFVSNENMESFKEVYPSIKTEKFHVVYNFINKDVVIKKSNDTIENIFSNSCINFVSVCRLVEQKALDRFIEIHAKIIKQGCMHKVYVIGDGPERMKLQKLINDCGVSETFILLGKKENPYPYVKNADYFCLLSYFEGYGMVLDEAKILNKKIIITNTAAVEALNDYENSLILENDKDSIYQGLFSVLTGNYIFRGNDQYKFDNEDRIQSIIDLL